MSNYSDKLKDPRWQKKRLEIMQRDEFTCQKCYDNESTLNVHHKFYFPDKEPWNYPNEVLTTLCEECHQEELINAKAIDEGLLQILHTIFFNESLHEIYLGLHRISIARDSRVTASIIGWAISSQDIMQMLDDKYFKHLHKQLRKRNAK